MVRLGGASPSVDLMRNSHTRSYPASLLPGLLGLAMGVAITSIGLGDDGLPLVYQTLPEFQLWRGAIIVQFTAFIGVAAYLADASGDPWLARLTPSEMGLIALMTVSAIGLPHVLVLVEDFPLPLKWQGTRMLFVVTSGLVAMVLLTNRLARIHGAHAAAQDPDAHRQIREATQDLLIIAAGTITLGTLGTGIFQTSLVATMEAFPDYVSPLNRGHVLAYGAYFAVLLLVFFAPIFSAERASAMRIRDGLEADRTSPVAGSVLPPDPDLGLESSLVQRLVAAFAVLTPLLGAIGSQLLP